MNIEFYNPSGEVKEWIIDYIKDKLMELHHRDKEISRAQVYFKQQTTAENDNKICEIDLTIYGDSLFVHQKATSYEQAARGAITELSEKVDERISKQSEPPDELTSTVDV